MNENLKLGMVGLDTSHCERFAELLNDPDSPQHIEGGKITAAFPGGSKNFSNSINRVAGFTKKLKEDFGVRIAGSIEEVAEEADAVFLTSVDGRQHPEQFAKIAPFGKPVFIDKPLATSVEDARRIFDLSEKHNAPFFSCSNARYRPGIAELGAGENIAGCSAWGPVAILEDYPGYFWYGVHCAEIIFSKMGAGCVEAGVHAAETADVISGKWDDGRIATIYGYRIEGQTSFGCTVFRKDVIESANEKAGPPSPYAIMLGKIMKFFNDKIRPVEAREMLEIVAFLEAANESREKGGPVKLEV